LLKKENHLIPTFHLRGTGLYSPFATYELQAGTAFFYRSRIGLSQKQQGLSVFKAIFDAKLNTKGVEMKEGDSARTNASLFAVRSFVAHQGAR
jgi:hypothetical protein